MIELPTMFAPLERATYPTICPSLTIGERRRTAHARSGSFCRLVAMAAAICGIAVLLSASSPAAAYTSAEEFLRSYDIDFSSKDIVSGQARIAHLDHERGLVTLVHEAGRSGDGSLTMPEMSMALQVANPHWLHDLSPGSIVRFKAARRRGAITIIAIEPVASQNPEK